MPDNLKESPQPRYVSILNDDGTVVDDSILPPFSTQDIVKMYELLVLSRTFDDRALSLQREGRIGTYPSILGQEAAQIGSAYALEEEDWVFPSFREMGVHITLGYPLHLLYAYWGGDERGLAPPANKNIFPICVAVGTHIPHAVGAAMAARYRKDNCAVVCYFGDGATSKGDFHEGLNMAGVFCLPVVFICQNNQWAISVPRSRQCAAGTLAQKAWGYGFEGVQVDGNDTFAVYQATREALDKARSGAGPTLIECCTYRMSDHTTADDASRYRSNGEVMLWRERDPIKRLRAYMERHGLWSDAFEQEVMERAAASVDGAVRMAEAMPPQEMEEMFIHATGTLSPRQRREMKEIHDGGP